MAGGQAITSGQGDLGVDSLETIALVGIAVTVSAGTIVAESPSDIPLEGEAFLAQAGIPLAGPIVSLRSRKVGGGSSTRALIGASSVVSAGDIVLSKGFPLTGISSTTATGTPTRSRSKALVGSSSTFSQGTVGIGGSGSVNVGTLQVDGNLATPEQIALFLPLTGTVATTATATCRYRVQGNTSWTTGHPLYRIRTGFSLTPGNGGAIEDGFAWTIIDLQPGTTYEVEVTVTDGANQSVRTLNPPHTTRSLPPAAGAVTVNVAAGSTAAQIANAINTAPAGAVIQLANGTYNLTGSISLTSGGSSGSPKYVRGASRTGVVLARSTVGEFFQLNANGISDIVIENMTIQGNGVDQDGNTASNYTAVLGQFSSTFQGSQLASRITLRNITATGVDRGVYVYRCEQLLVYDNSFTGNNLWQTSPVNFLDSNRTWNDDGALVAGIGNCVFNNFLKGFGDTCSCVQDDGSWGRSIHFYRNDIRNSCDDVLEVDDGRRNITFYDNRIHNSIDFDSLDPVYGGPVLLARNIYINVARSYPHKWNSQNSGFFLYNNTYVSTVTAVGFDQDVAAWYQTNNGQQRSWGYRNNIHVYRGNGITFWFDPTGNDPLDITHNSWFPNRAFQMAGQSFTNLADIQASISNRTPIFSGTNRPFSNDNITTTNPWTTTITLGATGNNEVTATYTPILATGSAPKNSGVAIPNITDNFTGLAPDRGAVIEGRSIPTYGDRSLVPEFIQSMSDFQARQLAGTFAPSNGTTTMESITPSEWLTESGVNFPGPLGVLIPWCGGFKGLTSKVNAHGGGHNDGSNNAVYVFDGSGTAQPVGWSYMGGSALSARRINQATYSDGRPTSVHTYDGLVYAHHNNFGYRFGGSQHNNGFMVSTAFKINFTNGIWTQLSSYPGSANPMLTIYDPTSRKIFVTTSTTSSGYFFRCDNDTWSASKSYTFGGNGFSDGVCGAWDTSRGRGIVIGSGGAALATIDFTNETVSFSNLGASGSTTLLTRYGIGCIYDPIADCYWAAGGGTGSPGYSSITRIAASNFACTSHSLSQNTGSGMHAEVQGSYGRISLEPSWRALYLINRHDQGPWVIKLPSA